MKTIKFKYGQFRSFLRSYNPELLLFLLIAVLIHIFRTEDFFGTNLKSQAEIKNGVITTVHNDSLQLKNQDSMKDNQKKIIERNQRVDSVKTAIGSVRNWMNENQ